MRPALLIALTLALGATLWLQQGEESDELVVAERSGPVGRAVQGGSQGGFQGRFQGGRGAAAQGARAGAGSDPVATGAWLVERVQAWQAQRAEDGALPPARAMSADAPSAWSAALPPPPPQPPPSQVRDAQAAPVAPPFPHQWVGRFDDEAVGGQKALRRAVISGPVSTWVAREGDVIEGQWRVDQIQERLMRLTYLPLQQSQTVAMK